jgi:hypothetical protein
MNILDEKFTEFQKLPTTKKMGTSIGKSVTADQGRF